MPSIRNIPRCHPWYADRTTGRASRALTTSGATAS